MAFNKAPSSWLTNYQFDGTSISFDLPADYTASMSDPLNFAYRVIDNIQKNYSNKPSADRPTRWESSVGYVQPYQTSPDIQKIITNKITLEADLFGGLATPSLAVSIETPDVAYSGNAYSLAVLSYPVGSNTTLEYSPDSGLTWTSASPVDRGTYTARLTATKDGRTGVATSTFTIGKSTPSISSSGDATATMGGGNQTIYFYCNQPITSVISQAPSVASVASFSYSQGTASVIVSVVSIGQTSIIATTSEDADNYSQSGVISFIVNGSPTSIEVPSSTSFDAATASGANQLEFTDFTTTGFSKTTDYTLIQFSSSDTSVATISKGSSYPPKINLLAPGSFTLGISFLGDSNRASSSASTSATIIGLPLTLGIAALSGPNTSNLTNDGSWSSATDSLTNSPDGAVYNRSGTTTSIVYRLVFGSSNTQFSYSFEYLWGASWANVSKSGNTITMSFSSIPTVTNGVGTVVIGKLVVSKPSSGLYNTWQNTFNVCVYIPPSGDGGGVGPTDPSLRTPSMTIKNVTNLYGNYTTRSDIATNCGSFSDSSIVATGNQDEYPAITLIKVDSVPSSLMWFGNSLKATFAYTAGGLEELTASTGYRTNDDGAIFEIKGTGKPGTGSISVSLPQNSTLGYKTFTITKSATVKKTFLRADLMAEQSAFSFRYKTSNTAVPLTYENIILQYVRASLYGLPCRSEGTWPSGSGTIVYHTAEKIPLIILPVPASM